MNKKFFVTTPIYYGSGRPHLGSLYSTVLADVVARWHMLNGNETYFLTGTDEHGQKIAEAAEKVGKRPKELVDEYAAQYKQLWQQYAIDYNKFIRTTDDEHKQAVIALTRLLLKKGDIYKGDYSGWYCTPCETFVPSPAGAGEQGPVCTSCGRATVHMSEPCYFFRLSAYQDRVLQFFKEHPDFVYPKERLNEVISFVEAGLKDLSISRSTIKWGIPFPDDPEHVIYVWLDALTNYIAAAGYGDARRTEEFATWWPADLHIVGKDIVRFHAVYWIAFLMAAQLPLPKHLLVHGWITVDGQKMSKSRGNVIDPVVLKDLYGADAVRYYLVSRLAVTQDADFSMTDLEHVVSQDLANELGNLLNRMLVLAQKHDSLQLHARKALAPESHELQAACVEMVQSVQSFLASYQFHLAYAQVKKFIGLVNAYVHVRQPWVQAGVDRDAFQETLSVVCHGLQAIAYVLWPVMPMSMEALLTALGKQLVRGPQVCDDIVVWDQAFTLVVVPPLFKKVEGVFEAMLKREGPATAVGATQQEPAAELIDITDFAKVHMVVGTITTAEAVPGSDKLLKMLVDCGSYGQRQILGGIKPYFDPAELVGKQGIFVVNLKPRKLMGLESHGMTLTAGDDKQFALLTPSKPVANGTRIK